MCAHNQHLNMIDAADLKKSRGLTQKLDQFFSFLNYIFSLFSLLYGILLLPVFITTLL